MKMLLPLFFLLLTVVNLRADLVAYYPFDSTSDASGSSAAHDGTLSGTAAIVGATTLGIPDRPFAPVNNLLLNIPVRGDFVNVLDHSDLDPESGSFSVTGWIRASDTSARQDIIAKQFPGAPFAGWSLRLSQSGNDRHLNVLLRERDNSGTLQSRGGTALTDNTWTHVAFTYDGSGAAAGIRIYVDGALETLTPTGANLTNPIDIGSNDSLNIGSIGGANNSGTNYQGQLDDLAIWKNQVLSPAQIEGLVIGIYTPLIIPEPSTFALFGLGLLLLRARKG